MKKLILFLLLSVTTRGIEVNNPATIGITDTLNNLATTASVLQVTTDLRTVSNATLTAQATGVTAFASALVAQNTGTAAFASALVAQNTGTAAFASALVAQNTGTAAYAEALTKLPMTNGIGLNLTYTNPVIIMTITTNAGVSGWTNILDGATNQIIVSGAGVEALNGTYYWDSNPTARDGRYPAYTNANTAVFIHYHSYFQDNPWVMENWFDEENATKQPVYFATNGVTDTWIGEGMGGLFTNPVPTVAFDVGTTWIQMVETAETTYTTNTIQYVLTPVLMQTNGVPVLYIANTNSAAAVVMNEGDWRMQSDGTNLLFQCYESAVWVTKETILKTAP
jgi:hypothetical protein